ncbi:MAG: hypothetical protein E7351_00170 [Clostridiales bacterium]|nr:hypothetical protein [Clostridiales bacterium]
MIWISFPVLTVMVLSDNLENGFSYIVFGIPFCMLNPHLSTLLYFVAIVLYIIKLCIIIFVKEKKQLNRRLIISLAVFVVYCLLPIGEYNNNVWLKLCLILFILLAIIIFSLRPNTFRPELNICMVSYAFIIASAFSLTYHISPHLQNIFRINTAGDIVRFQALFDHTNVFAMACEIVLSLLACMIITKEKKLKFSILFGVLAVLGLLTLSKTYIITLFIICLCIFIWLVKKNPKRTLIITGIVISCGLLIILIFPKVSSLFFERFLGSLQECRDFKDVLNMITTGRVNLWLEYLSYIFTHPKTLIFGNGLGANVVNKMSSHNAYISMLYQLGIVGISLLVGVIVMIIKNNKKSTKTKFNKALLIPLIVIGLIMFVEDTIFYIVFR